MGTLISALDFIKKFNAPGKPVDTSLEYEIDDAVEFDRTNYNCDYASLLNVKFNGLVSFSGALIRQGILFENCEFKKGIVFSDTKAVGYDPDKVLGFYSIILKDCTCRNILVDKSFFERGFKVFKTRVTKKVHFSNLSIPINNLQLEKSIFGSIDLRGVVLDGTGISISKCEVKNFVKLAQVRTKSGISLIESKFLRDVHMWGGSTMGITLNDCDFSERVHIHAIKNEGALSINNSKFKKVITIDCEDKTNKWIGSHKAIYFDGPQFSNAFILNGSNQIIENLLIPCSAEFTGTLYFNSCNILDVEFSSDNHKGTFVFNYVNFGRVFFNNFNNYGNLTISSCKAIRDATKSEFTLYNTNLGKSQFQNFFWDSFSKVAIIDSLVANIEFSGIHWFNETKLDVGDSTAPWKRKREVYRQLKQASEKQNDKFQALEFQAIELKAFRDFLFNHKKFWTNDGLILWLGQTNDYGLNWWKPVWILIVISTILYFPIVISASNAILWKPACNISDVSATLSEFVEYSYFWPQLFNPARTLKHALAEEANLNFGVYFWDAIQRIILAFFLVQTVSAFRKFFKS